MNGNVRWSETDGSETDKHNSHLSFEPGSFVDYPRSTILVCPGRRRYKGDDVLSWLYV